MIRNKAISRTTADTSIKREFSIDGTWLNVSQSGVGFLDHMLMLMMMHGQFGLNGNLDRDIEVDQHDTVEDIGIVIGRGFQERIGTKEESNRYGTLSIPMDE